MMGVWFLGDLGRQLHRRPARRFYESMPLPSLFMAVAAFAIGAGS